MPIIEKYFFWFMYSVAGELLLFSTFVLILIRWGTKLHNHVRSEHPEFYEANLASPLYAGDTVVFKKQLRSLKNTYFGQMPDEMSTYYQRRLRQLATVTLLLLLSGVITFLVAVIVFLVDA